ncbi:hypothetical protein SETIT_9G178700v2 [Setaria italica]|uniref:RING-type domain-containing protein n=2 Tax=Setaria italica TaxID=4555 RepID=A0A368SHT5_SETIT|nr:hypothetical protein SETIT_9G178700v2 [Setaria italica]
MNKNARCLPILLPSPRPSSLETPVSHQISSPTPTRLDSDSGKWDPFIPICLYKGKGWIHRSKRARVAATSEDIMGLPEVTGRSRSGEECAVCLQDFGADEKLRAMPCSHAFHQHCISEWLRRKAVCPLCRHRLHTEDDDEQIS